MAFGGKVDHSVGPIGLEEMLHKLCIADVAMHENMPRIAGQFGLDTSTKANLMSGVYAAQTAINISKTVVKAVAA